MTRLLTAVAVVLTVLAAAQAVGTAASRSLSPSQKGWLCTGTTAGPRFRMQGRYGPVGECYPAPNVVDGFRWHPDDTRDRLTGN